eukprot:6183230-Pleurochrysis_carterae.AAC.1
MWTSRASHQLCKSPASPSSDVSTLETRRSIHSARRLMTLSHPDAFDRPLSSASIVHPLAGSRARDATGITCGATRLPPVRVRHGVHRYCLRVRTAYPRPAGAPRARAHGRACAHPGARAHTQPSEHARTLVRSDRRRRAHTTTCAHTRTRAFACGHIEKHSPMRARGHTRACRLFCALAGSTARTHTRTHTRTRTRTRTRSYAPVRRRTHARHAHTKASMCANARARADSCASAHEGHQHGKMQARSCAWTRERA